MNWINLLYPRPHFAVTTGPTWLRKTHSLALNLAYYLTHSVALIGLSVIYFALILPLKFYALLRGQDLLEKTLSRNAITYLKKSEDLSSMDFKRMY